MLPHCLLLSSKLKGKLLDQSFNHEIVNHCVVASTYRHYWSFGIIQVLLQCSILGSKLGDLLRELGIDDGRLFGLFQFEQLVAALVSHQLHPLVLEESAPSAQTRLQLLSEGVDFVLKHQLNFIRVRISVCFIHTRAKYNT